ncbi:hypothetical protein CRM22_009877 [Opisthorchis felineus]|uniref:FAD-binding FR-type domain-containing protein n=1 Tax=Opisthorchis felineus TaxID=147828 RepID=A0A4S2L4X8_OPIFE|nr:hypothetical protein CRM22_009877 [Opisthorchis felineus]TGZ57721.1 hypothetical protein CRM22_009877 [Opisthorchis felineus]
MNDTLISAASALSISAQHPSEKAEVHPPDSLVLLGDSDFVRRNEPQKTLTLPNLLVCPFLIKPYESGNFEFTPNFKPSSSSLFPAASGELLNGTLRALQPITGEESKVVYQATVVLNNQKIRCEPGDSVALLCSNSSVDVDWLLKRIDLDPLTSEDQPFILQPTLNKPIPAWLLPGIPTTARQLLTHCCELHVPVSRRIIRLCAEFCSTDSRQATRLRELCSREYTELFDKYVRLQNVTLPDLLHLFPACRLPLIRLLEVLPRLQPRPYTLISLHEGTMRTERETENQQLQFIFTRVDFGVERCEAGVGISRYPHRTHGVCTGWLERIWPSNAGSPIQLYLRCNLNGFRLPADPEQPVIMIAAGTGLAPFISFIRKLRSLGEAARTSGESPLWLIFGCRSPKSLLFLEELTSSVRDKTLHRWCLCFSRHVEPSDSTTPYCLHTGVRYVQECICSSMDESPLTEHQTALAVWILHRKARIMVCGEARAMAPAVREACATLLTKAMTKKFPLLCPTEPTLLSGSDYVEKMRQDGRYIEDIWT